ncbi:MAG TPA: hypothetical protein DEB73_02595 [Candidatus Magasanikbacteria bacterium]|nr:hypothetical protein [Candidatus Magasanikbacteria bacterium]
MKRIIKKFVFILVVLISSVLLVNRVFVYDTNIAHPGLTKLAAELYNQQGGQLNSQEIKWLMQGAIEEDTPFRWMNHFYDPIHIVGLKSSYDTAKKWAENASNQASYAKGDQTWQRAIYYWQTGNKEKSLIALGHILHLLEDMTVPAHTRDDAHPEGDPYEVWVKNNFKAINGEWIYFNKLEKYFDYLANYSNNNFYSEDTIESKKFTLLNIDGFDAKEVNNGFVRKYFFGNNIVKKYLFWVDVKPLWLGGNTIKESVDDNLILSNHYSLLAPKAIGAGAGVIKLFFEETQKQQTYAKPFWQINPLGIAQGETVGTAENLAQIYQNTSIQLGNLWNAGKKLLWNVGDAQITYDFFTELFATNIVLAQELKNLQQTGQNLVAVPIKIAQETGESIVETMVDFSFRQPAEAQNDKNEIALPAARNDIGDIASVKAFNNDSGNNLLSGFVTTPSLPAVRDSSAMPQNDKKVTDGYVNQGSVSYSGGGSSWSSTAPASGVPGGSGSNASPSSAVSAVEDSSAAPQDDKRQFELVLKKHLFGCCRGY